MPIVKNSRLGSGPVRGYLDLLNRTMQFITNGPGENSKKFVVVLLAEKQRYVYLISAARSHRAARELALKQHERRNLPSPEIFHVAGKCQKRRCKCRGGHCVLGGLRCPNEAWSGYEFACTKLGFPGMMAAILDEQDALLKFRSLEFKPMPSSGANTEVTQQ